MVFELCQIDVFFLCFLFQNTFFKLIKVGHIKTENSYIGLFVLQVDIPV